MPEISSILIVKKSILIVNNILKIACKDMYK